MCRPQDLTAEMPTQDFGVFKHVKVEDGASVLSGKRPHFHEEETSDSDLSDSEKHSAQRNNEPKTKKRKIWRVMLSPHQALEIYNRRPPLKQIHGKCGYAHGSMRNARIVAQDYNVSAKTIRDIWNRYSWAKVTRQLWTDEEAKHYAETYTVRGHQGIASLTGRRGSDPSISRTTSHEGLGLQHDGLRTLDDVDDLLHNPLGTASLSHFSPAASATKLPRIQTIESLISPLGSAFPSNADPKLVLPLLTPLQQAPSLIQTLLGSKSQHASLAPAASALPLSLQLPTSGPTLQAQIDESKRRLQELISLNQRCIDHQRLTLPLVAPLPLPRI